MPRSTAVQGFSDAIADCINATTRLRGLLERISDADQKQLSCDINELTTAVRAIANAVNGVASVAQLEAARNNL